MIEDPLSTQQELERAYQWFEEQVFEWKAEHGLLTTFEIDRYMARVPIMGGGFVQGPTIDLSDGYYFRGKFYERTTASTGPQ